MKVLFIGATGFVGSNVVPFLAQHFDLTLAAPAEDVIGNIKICPLDITHWEETLAFMKRGADGVPFDAIVYCATASYRKRNLSDMEDCLRYYEDCIDVNMRGAYHVMEAAWRTGVARVVHIGSLTAVMGAPRYEYIHMETLDRPRDLYAATKIFAENLGHTYAFRPDVTWSRSQDKQLGRNSMSVLCLRLGQPTTDILYPQRREIMQHEYLPNKRHKNKRRGEGLMVHMEDIAQAIECALQTDTHYGVYPIVSATDNPFVDPVLYEELKYKPRWKFDAIKAVRVEKFPVLP